MTAPLQIGGVYEVRIWTVQAEQAAVNTVHFLVLATSGTATNDVDMARVVESTVATLMKSIMSTDCSFRGTQVTLKTVAAGSSPPATVFSNALVGAGAEAPPDCPRQISGLIHWSTPLGGRRNRGRFYMPFPSTGNVQTDGIPTAAYQTVLSNLATALLNLTTITNVGASGNATVDLVLFHRAAFGVTPPVPTPVTGFIIPAKFATQKRRGSYGRPNNSPL